MMTYLLSTIISEEAMHFGSSIQDHFERWGRDDVIHIVLVDGMTHLYSSDSSLQSCNFSTETTEFMEIIHLQKTIGFRCNVCEGTLANAAFDL
jgi:hypothetical protein